MAKQQDRNVSTFLGGRSSAALNAAAKLFAIRFEALIASSLGKALTTGAAVLGSFALQEAAIPNRATASLVYDSTPDTTLGTGIGNGLNGTSLSSAFSRATFIPIIGNGRAISEVGLYWQYGSNGGANTGSYQHYDWVVGMILNPDVSSHDIVTVINTAASNTGGADYRAYFSDPLPGYDTVRSTNSNGVNNHLAIFDLASLNFNTIQGQQHWLFVAPIQYNNSNTSLGAAYGINSSGNQPNYFDRLGDAFGTRRYDEMGAPRNGVAGYIRTAAVPEPTSGLLLGSFLTAMALASARYRKD